MRDKNFSYLTNDPKLSEVIPLLKKDFSKAIERVRTFWRMLPPDKKNQHIFVDPDGYRWCGDEAFFPCLEHDSVVVYDPDLDIVWPFSFSQYSKVNFNPERYLKMLNDRIGLEKVINEALNEGVFLEGLEDSLNDSSDMAISYVDHIVWLYRNSENKEFRKNLEEVLVNFSKRELNKKFEPPKERESGISGYHHQLLVDNSNGFIGRTWNLIFSTLDSTENNRKFNRLNVLLELIARLGKPTNSFNNLSDLLEHNVEKWSRLLYDPFCLECKSLLALSSVEKGNNNLTNFWWEHFRKSVNNEKYNSAMASAIGFVSSYNSINERKKALSRLLKFADENNVLTDDKLTLSSRLFCQLPFGTALPSFLVSTVYEKDFSVDAASCRYTNHFVSLNYRCIPSNNPFAFVNENRELYVLKKVIYDVEYQNKEMYLIFDKISKEGVKSLTARINTSYFNPPIPSELSRVVDSFLRVGTFPISDDLDVRFELNKSEKIEVEKGPNERYAKETFEGKIIFYTPPSEERNAVNSIRTEVNFTRDLIVNSGTTHSDNFRLSYPGVGSFDISQATKLFREADKLEKKRGVYNPALEYLSNKNFEELRILISGILKLSTHSYVRARDSDPTWGL